MPPGSIRIMVLGCEPLVDSLLVHALSSEPDFSIAAAARHGSDPRASWRDASESDDIDIAIVDLAALGGAAIALLPEIHARFPQCRIVAFDSSRRASRLRAVAVASGAAVALAAGADLPDLVDAIRKAHWGETLIAPNELHALLRDATMQRAASEKAQSKFARLTPREIEIVQALARGSSDNDIAADLEVKPKTIATHVTHVLKKLEVASRLQAALFAIRHEFVEFERN